MEKINQYYIWQFGDLDLDNHQPPKLISSDDIKGLSFNIGDYISRQLPVINFVVNRKRILTDYQFNIPGFPLFSQKLQQALEGIGINNIEYFPACLLTKTGKLISDDYQVGNVVGRVACFDWENSEYDDIYRDEGIVIHIDKLVIDMSRIQGQLLFRMDESPSILLVADSVKQHLELKGITGIEFAKIDDYQI
jgi:hypothetical protein